MIKFISFVIARYKFKYCFKFPLRFYFFRC